MTKEKRSMRQERSVKSSANSDKLIRIGERVKKMRKRRDYSQEDFAEVLGVSSMTVSRIENGMTPMSVLLLGRMTEVLQVSSDEILNDEKKDA